MSNVLRVEFPPALMGKELAAYYIGKSPRYVDYLREQGQITAYGDTKNPEFKRTELDEWIDRRPEKHSGGAA
jgi:hypothetical protein